MYSLLIGDPLAYVTVLQLFSGFRESLFLPLFSVARRYVQPLIFVIISIWVLKC
jgi:hypothetical protein